MLWKQNAHWATMAAWGIGLTTCLLLPPAMAQDAAAGDQGDSWKAERTKLEELVAQRLKEEVEKNAKTQDIAAKLGFKWPVLAPTKKKEEVEADVEKQLEEMAATQFPEARRKEFEKEAGIKYRMCEVGDEVAFAIRGGVGPNTTVKGRLQEKTAQRIKTGSRTVLRTDMNTETQALFWEDVNSEFRRNYIRVQNTQYDAKITAFKDEQREVKLPEALRAAHYVHVQKKALADALRLALSVPEPPKGANRKLAEWFAEAEVLELYHKKQVDAIEADQKPKITAQVFESNGYEQVEDTENNTKEWMPKVQAKTFRERLQALIEKKKQDELEAGAAKQGAADPWGAATPPGGAAGAMPPGPAGMRPGPAGGMPPGPAGAMPPGPAGAMPPGPAGAMPPGMRPGPAGAMPPGPAGAGGAAMPPAAAAMMPPAAAAGMMPPGQAAAAGAKPAGAGKPAGKNGPFDENQW